MEKNNRHLEEDMKQEEKGEEKGEKAELTDCQTNIKRHRHTVRLTDRATEKGEYEDRSVSMGQGKGSFIGSD